MQVWSNPASTERALVDTAARVVHEALPATFNLSLLNLSVSHFKTARGNLLSLEQQPLPQLPLQSGVHQQHSLRRNATAAAQDTTIAPISKGQERLIAEVNSNCSCYVES